MCLSLLRSCFAFVINRIHGEIPWQAPAAAEKVVEPPKEPEKKCLFGGSEFCCEVDAVGPVPFLGAKMCTVGWRDASWWGLLCSRFEFEARLFISEVIDGME